MNTEQDSSKLNIIDNNCFSYDYYKKLVDKYSETDGREINFQNRIILPFLEKVFVNTDIMIIDVSTQYKNRNSKNHDNSQYTAEKASPPDLLITRNWNIDNKNNEVDYLAAIEIKSPVLDPINNTEIKKYKKHTKDQLESHLSKHSKVILTDCVRWQFFEAEKGLKPITIDLLNIGNTERVEPYEWHILCDTILNIAE